MVFNVNEIETIRAASSVKTRVTSDLEESITSITNRMKVIFMSECAQSKQITNHKQMLVNAKMT